MYNKEIKKYKEACKSEQQKPGKKFNKNRVKKKLRKKLK